jgi:hypothetical protein
VQNRSFEAWPARNATTDSMSDAPVSNDLSSPWPATILAPTAAIPTQQDCVPEQGSNVEGNRKRRQPAEIDNSDADDDFALPLDVHAIDRLA